MHSFTNSFAGPSALPQNAMNSPVNKNQNRHVCLNISDAASRNAPVGKHRFTYVPVTASAAAIASRSPINMGAVSTPNWKMSE